MQFDSLPLLPSGETLAATGQMRGAKTDTVEPGITFDMAFSMSSSDDDLSEQVELAEAEKVELVEVEGDSSGEEKPEIVPETAGELPKVELPEAASPSEGVSAKIAGPEAPSATMLPDEVASVESADRRIAGERLVQPAEDFSVTHSDADVKTDALSFQISQDASGAVSVGEEGRPAIASTPAVEMSEQSRPEGLPERMPSRAQSEPVEQVDEAEFRLRSNTPRASGPEAILHAAVGTSAQYGESAKNSIPIAYDAVATERRWATVPAHVVPQAEPSAHVQLANVQAGDAAEAVPEIAAVRMGDVEKAEDLNFQPRNSVRHPVFRGPEVPVSDALNTVTANQPTLTPAVDQSGLEAAAVTDELPELVASRSNVGSSSSPPGALDVSLARPNTVKNAAVHAVEVFSREPGKTVEIALNPEELGRVRMALSTSDAGVTVLITSERPETLELMRRNIEQLSQEFKRLGYEQTSFQFNGENSGGDGRSSGGSFIGTAAEDAGDIQTIQPTRLVHTGLDLRL